MIELIVALGLSVAANIFLAVKIARMPKRRKFTESEEEAFKFIEDLKRFGGGMVKVQRVSPGDVWLRSP